MTTWKLSLKISPFKIEDLISQMCLIPFASRCCILVMPLTMLARNPSEKHALLLEDIVPLVVRILRVEKASEVISMYFGCKYYVYIYIYDMGVSLNGGTPKTP